MSRSWNGKALVDIYADRIWSAVTTTAQRNRVLRWINEIQDDIASELPMDYFLFKLKKLIPTQQEEIDLNPQIPDAPTTAIAAGGSLTENSTYKVYITFLVYDANTSKYMESAPSLAGTARQADASNKTIDLTAVDTYDGDTSIKPDTIYRNVYVATLADGETEYGEPFYHGQIADNTTTTYSITSEPSSTITPPSASELDQLSSKHMYFNNDNRYLVQQPLNKLERFYPGNRESTSPEFFDYIGTDRIFLSAKLSSSATTAQRTLTYWVYRRPHEVFYTADRAIDLPIQMKKVLEQGIVWKSYEYKDRDGKISEFNKYQEMKREIIKRLKRKKGVPAIVRDTMGDTYGYEV